MSRFSRSGPEQQKRESTEWIPGMINVNLTMGCCCSSSTYLTTKGTEAEGVQQAALTRLAGIGNSFGRSGLRPFIQKHHARAVDDVSLDACDIQHLLNLRDSDHIVVRRTSNLQHAATDTRSFWSENTLRDPLTGLPSQADLRSRARPERERDFSVPTPAQHGGPCVAAGKGSKCRRSQCIPNRRDCIRICARLRESDTRKRTSSPAMASAIAAPLPLDDFGRRLLRSL